MEKTMKELIAIDKVMIYEAKEGVNKGKIICRVTTDGLTFMQNRFYTKEALQQGYPMYEGARMFLNHPTMDEEMERPERAIEDMIATLRGVVLNTIEGGKVAIEGEVIVHGSPKYSADTCREWLKNLKTAGVEDVISQNILYLGYWGEAPTADGGVVETNIVEKIIKVNSVDFVTHANAGGLLVAAEALKNKTVKGGEPEMTKDEVLKSLSLDEVKSSRKDLYETIAKEAVQMAGTEKEKEDFKTQLEAKDAIIAKQAEQINAAALADKKKVLAEKFEAACKEAALPEAMLENIKKTVTLDKVTLETKDEDFLSSAADAIKAGKELVAKLTATGNGPAVIANGGSAEVVSIDTLLMQATEAMTGKKS